MRQLLSMKSLFDDFVLLRTNAIQRRRFDDDDQVLGDFCEFSKQPVLNCHFLKMIDDDSHVRLLRDDCEYQANGKGLGPPSFVGQSEALQYQMTRLESKVEQLHSVRIANP